MLIVYKSWSEFFVISEEKEAEFLDIYFSNGSREISDFDREVFEGVVEISTKIIPKRGWC
jgi:hypothetical protein